MDAEEVSAPYAAEKASAAEDAELQLLTEQYEAQAAQERQAVLQVAKRKKPVAQMSKAELQSEGLANPLSSDNR